MEEADRKIVWDNVPSYFGFPDGKFFASRWKNSLYLEFKRMITSVLRKLVCRLHPDTCYASVLPSAITGDR